MPLHPRPRWKSDFHIWSRLRGNGDHTPDPDLESFKTRLRDTLRFGDLRELSVPLLSGTSSRFGTGVGEEQRAVSGGNRPSLTRRPGQPVAVAPCACRLCCVACSKSIACQICAPLGHGPKTGTVRRIAAAHGAARQWLPSPFTATHDSAEFGFSPVTSVNQRNRIIQL